MRVATHGSAGQRAQAGRGSWPLLGVFFFGLYAIATVAPTGALWGLHSLGYLPWWMRASGLVVCAALLWTPAQELAVRFANRLFGPFLTGSRRGHELLLPMALLAFVVFCVFRIRTDIYGDSTTILRAYADNTAPPLARFAQVFSLNILAHREALTLALHQAVAHLFGLSIGNSFRLISALSGVAYVLLWALFVRRTMASSPWGALLIPLGCLIGANQIFFGHIETYPLASLASLAFLLVGWRAIDQPRLYWATLVLLLLCIAAHPASVYFVPVFLVLSAYVLSRRLAWIQTWLTWRRLALMVVVPSLLIGLWLYLFYFRSFAEPYTGTGREFAHSFLPMVPAPPPLDKYNLQSINHLRDLANVLLLVGMPAILGVLGLVMFHFREIAWEHPEVKFATLGLAYPLLFFVAVNPALSMPRDWDMYALLGPSLLVLLTALLAHSGDRVPKAQFHGTSLAFSVFSLAFWALDASPRPLSARLETVGEYVFTTYHTSASFILNRAHSMEPDTTLALQRRTATLKRLASHVVGEDLEYMNLLTTLARMYRDRGDLDHGSYWMAQAVRLSPHDANASLWLADAYLQARRPQAAVPLLATLLQSRPQDPNALMLSAIAASQENDLQGARSYLERAKAADPTDPQIDAWLADVRRALASRPAKGANRARTATERPADPPKLVGSQ